MNISLRAVVAIVGSLLLTAILTREVIRMQRHFNKLELLRVRAESIDSETTEKLFSECHRLLYEEFKTESARPFREPIKESSIKPTIKSFEPMFVSVGQHGLYIGISGGMNEQVAFEFLAGSSAENRSGKDQLWLRLAKGDRLLLEKSDNPQSDNP